MTFLQRNVTQIVNDIYGHHNYLNFNKTLSIG